MGCAGEGFPKTSDLCSGDLLFLQLSTSTHSSVLELLTMTEGEQAAAEHQQGAAFGAVGDVQPLLGGKPSSPLLQSTSVSASHLATLQAGPLGPSSAVNLTVRAGWEGNSPPCSLWLATSDLITRGRRVTMLLPLFPFRKL